jgi:hypothetical protein
MSPEERARLESELEQRLTTYASSRNPVDANAALAVARRLGTEADTLDQVKAFGFVDPAANTPPPMASEERTRLEDEYRQAGARFAENKTEANALAYLDIGRQLGRETETLDRLKFLGIPDGVDPALPPPHPEYVAAEAAFDSDPLNPVNRSNLARETQVLLNNGYPDSAVDVLKLRYEQFDAARGRDPAKYDQLQGLVNSYGDALRADPTGRQAADIFSQAAMLAGDLQIVAPVMQSLEYHKATFDAEQQKAATDAYYAERDRLAEAMFGGGMPTQGDIGNLLKLQEQAGPEVGRLTGEALMNSIATRKTELAQEQFQNALDSVRNTFTVENINALRDTARRTGLSEEAEAAIADMDNTEKQNALQEVSSYLSFLDSGNDDLAINALEELGAAYHAQNTPEAQEEFQSIRQDIERIRAGEGRELLAEAALELSLLGIPEADAYIEGLARHDTNRRLNLATEANIAEMMSRSDFRTPAAQERAGDMVQDLGLNAAEAMIKGMEVYDQLRAANALTQEDVINLSMDVANDLDADTQLFRNAMTSFEDIIATDNATSISGMSDTALISLYALLLDPGSTVREGEANRIGAAQGWWDRLGTLEGKIQNGQVLSQEARRAIIDVGSAIYDANKSRLETYNTRAREFVDAIDPRGTYGVGRMVFLPDRSKPTGVVEERAY